MWVIQPKIYTSFFNRFCLKPVLCRYSLNMIYLVCQLSFYSHAILWVSWPGCYFDDETISILILWLLHKPAFSHGLQSRSTVANVIRHSNLNNHL